MWFSCHDYNSSLSPFQAPQCTREHWRKGEHEKQKWKVSSTEILPGIPSLPITGPKGAIRTIPVFVLQLPLIPWNGEWKNILVATVLFKEPCRGYVAEMGQSHTSNDTSVSYTAQCYKGGSGKPTALSTSILVLFLSPKPDGNWVSVINATLCPRLDEERYMYPILERNREMVPRGELNTKASPTQDGNAENRTIFLGECMIFMWNNWVKPVPC